MVSINFAELIASGNLSEKIAAYLVKYAMKEQPQQPNAVNINLLSNYNVSCTWEHLKEKIQKNIYTIQNICKIFFSIAENDLCLMPMTPYYFKLLPPIVIARLIALSEDFKDNHNVANFWVIQDLNTKKIVGVFNDDNFMK